MSSPLFPGQTDCCTPTCPSPITTSVPGPPGSPGTNGNNGTNGENAFTTTTAQFIVPAVNATVTVTVANDGWPALNQPIFITTAGFYQITGIAGLTLTIKNLGYSGNAALATAIPPGSQVTPSGIIGATGPAGSGGFVDPATTKGDLIVDNGANSPSPSPQRLGIGPNGEVLTADSTQPLGMKYQAIDLSGVSTVLAGQTPIGNGGTGQGTKAAAFDALSPAVVKGDLIYFDGTHNVKIPIGSALSVLQVNNAGTDIGWSGTLKNLLQMVEVGSSTYNSIDGAGTAFSKNAVPTTAMGTQILSVSITPTTLTSRLVIRVSASLNLSPGGNTIVMALFNGTTGIATVAFANAAYPMVPLTLVHEFVPGALTPITFNVRAGTIAGATALEFNGLASSGWNETGTPATSAFGGTMESWMIVEEYA